jgi:hypothetical protein
MCNSTLGQGIPKTVKTTPKRKGAAPQIQSGWSGQLPHARISQGSEFAPDLHEGMRAENLHVIEWCVAS